MPLRPASPPTRESGIVFRLLAVLVAFAIALPAPASAQSRMPAPDSLTDSEFWKFFTSMSEPDGYFLSENFVSNEVSLQEVIPSLQRSLTRDGVYLGVGPEQNFTYIANLGSRMAVIFDIRRQNAMQHLMYKALFELSPTRVQFVSRLFSRPSVARLGRYIGVHALFDSAGIASRSDSAYEANLAAIVRLLTRKHGFALSKDDIASIEHVYGVFFAAGPEVNYGYRSGNPGFVRSTYPSYGLLQEAVNADSVQMAFLATEDNYQAVRRLQSRNLIVPVVGDFGGPTAIRAVGKWLREREMTVTAFYVSNVEQYLFRDPGASDRFYSSVSALPIDTTSRFIRSVPRTSGWPTTPLSRVTTGRLPAGTRYIITQDAVGNTVTRTFRDSAGVTLVQTTVDSVRRTGTPSTQAARDSAGISRLIEITARVTRDSVSRDTGQAALRAMLARRDSIIRLNSQWQVAAGRGMQMVMGGLLTSGLASMKGTLDAFFLGELKSYNAVIEMTKVSGWR
ncbi:MAG TPA: hypothetical protein VIK50_02310 [Gemmatimonadaceae bacterium]